MTKECIYTKMEDSNITVQQQAIKTECCAPGVESRSTGSSQEARVTPHHSPHRIKLHTYEIMSHNITDTNWRREKIGGKRIGRSSFIFSIVKSF